MYEVYSDTCGHPLSSENATDDTSSAPPKRSRPRAISLTARSITGSQVQAASAGKNHTAWNVTYPESMKAAPAVDAATRPSSMRRAYAYVAMPATARCATVSTSIATAAGVNRKIQFGG